MPPIWVRKWHYKRYFAGDQVFLAPLDWDKERVIEALNQKHHHDNWITKSLKQGKKVKATETPLTNHEMMVMRLSLQAFMSGKPVVQTRKTIESARSALRKIQNWCGSGII